MAQLPSPPFYLIDSTADYVRLALEAVTGGSEYKIFRAELPDYSDEIELYYGMADYYEDSTVYPSTLYYYRAIALANGGLDDSDYSTLSTTTPADNPLPTPTIGLIAADKFFIRWQISPITGAYQYYIERSTEPTFLMPDTFISDDVLWEDATVQPSTEYYYRVRAIPYPGNGFTYSAWSVVESATTTDYDALPAPGLSTSEVTDSSVKLTLTGVIGGENYNIMRSIDPLFGSSVNVYFGPANVYVDQPLIGDTTYYYRAYAAATTTNNQSPFSDVEEITTLEPVIPDPSDDPIPGLKYFMQFADMNSATIDVRMYFNGYSGSVISVTGSGEPVQINYTGFDKDIYDNGKSIIDAKYTINLLNPGFSESFYEDITSADDGQVWVRIERETDNTIFSGWLISDEFKRSFDLTMYEVSLTVVSPLSLMKSTELLESDGRMMFGSKSIADIVNACLRASIHPALAQRYDIYTSMRETDYVGTLDLFNQLRFYIEAANDSNGRPPKCYDVLEKIANSFGFIVYWVNDRLIFCHSYDGLQPVKNIKIREGENTGFLIANSEVITKTRTSKEVSLKYEYGAQIGLLRDGRFLQATSNVLDYWSYLNLRTFGASVSDYITPRWSGNPTGTVERKGNGRKVNPFRMRFWGETSSQGIIFNLRDETYQQGLVARSNRFNAGDTINLKLRYKYFDWRRKYNYLVASEKVPYLYITVFAVPPNGNWQELQTVYDLKNIEGTNIESISDQTPSWSTPFALSGQIFPIRIAVESTTDIQNYEFTLPWRFTNYELQVAILGVRWDSGKPLAISGSDIWIDIMDVIVSKEAETEGYKATGEEIYLTQLKAGKIDETKDVFLGTFNNPDISGALLKGDNTISRGVARGGTGDLLQNWMVRMMMAQKRGPRYKADFEYKSSDIRPFDLFTLSYADGSLLPNKYAIGSMDYNMKSAESKVTVIEVNTQDREYKIGGDESETEGDYIDEPTGDFDMLENYKTY